MKILTVVGARPQFIKAAAVSRVIATNEGINEVMVHTGQHFDANMSDVFFSELQIPTPAHHLKIHGGGHGEMTGKMMGALEAVMQQEQPDIVLIYGDTNSTLAGALCAAKLHVPVAHVEAGLRSYNRRMPEEINRVVADHTSDLLLCPTAAAVANLAAEGILNGVTHTGDVMYDAALHAANQESVTGDILNRLNLNAGEYSVATVHRAENTDTASQLKSVLTYLKKEATELPVVLPIHPRTKQAADRFGLDFDGLILCPPVGYIDMARLVANAVTVHTDSGGLQKEAYFHQTPCVTLRDETEWVETIEAGWNRLWKMPDYATRTTITDYGDGHAAEKVVAAIANR